MGAKPAKSGKGDAVYRGLRTGVMAILAPIAAATAIATAIGFFGAQSPPLDLASHFRMWYVVILVPVTIASALLRHRQAAVLGGLALAANLVVISPLYIHPAGGRPPDPAHSDALRLLQFNVETANDNKVEVANYVNASDSDLVLVQEVDTEWLDVLGSVASLYEVVEEVARGDNFGIAVLSRKQSGDRFRILDSSVLALVADRPDRPAIALTLEWQGGRLDLLTLHTMPPRGLSASALRDRQLEAAAEWANVRSGSHAIVGDLNATMWSAPFRQLIGNADLVSSERGFGYQGTWQSQWSWPFRLPIDHVLMSRDLVAVGREVGPELGSDHRPIHVLVERQ